MSADPELTEQMPWVHTSDGRDVLEAIHQKTGMSRAAIMRYAYNRVFGLVGTGYLPTGKTVEDVIAPHVKTLGARRDRHARNEV
jgi:hypothetical protein